MAKTSFLSKEQKEHHKGEVGQAKRGTCHQMMSYGSFEDRLLHIRLAGYRLTGLIDSCKLHNNRL